MATDNTIDPTEHLWIQQAQQGDLTAFNAIVERYQRLAYNLAFRMMRDPSAAENIVQEAFFSAYRSIRRFRGGSLRGWLFTIVANACRDQLRSPRRRRTVSLDALAEANDSSANPSDPGPTPEEHALRQEVSSQVQVALSRLPYDQRLVVALVDLQGLDYQEAAAVAGSSLGTVKSRLSRGRDRLRQILQPMLELSG